MRRLLSLFVIATLALVACGDGVGDTTEPETTSTTAATTTTITDSTTTSAAPETTTSTSATTTTTRLPGGGPTVTCDSPEGFTVEYPEKWETNRGDVVPECTMFHPEPFEVEPATDQRFAAITINVENVDYDTVTSSSNTEDVRSLDELTVDGQNAVRVEREASGDALLPAGTLSTSYYVELGDTGSTLIADTVEFASIDYSTAVAVLDEMVSTIQLDVEQASGVQPVGEFVSLPIESPGFPSSSGETSLLVDVRHGVHQGFERIVFEFEQGSDLSYALEYVDEAVPPSGNPVDVAGDVILSATATPASGVDLSGGEAEETYEGPDRLEIDSDLVGDLVLVEDFESVLTWAIGLRRETSAAVTTLDDPHRLVIDLEAD